MLRPRAARCARASWGRGLCRVCPAVRQHVYVENGPTWECAPISPHVRIQLYCSGPSHKADGLDGVGDATSGHALENLLVGRLLDLSWGGRRSGDQREVDRGIAVGRPQCGLGGWGFCGAPCFLAVSTDFGGAGRIRRIGPAQRASQPGSGASPNSEPPGVTLGRVLDQASCGPPWCREDWQGVPAHGLRPR